MDLSNDAWFDLDLNNLFLSGESATPPALRKWPISPILARITGRTARPARIQ